MRVREALDLRDGSAGKMRFEIYEMFSELAAHPNMKSVLMMRPMPDGDAVTIGEIQFRYMVRPLQRALEQNPPAPSA